MCEGDITLQNKTAFSLSPQRNAALIRLLYYISRLILNVIGLTFKHNVSTKFIAVSVKTFELAIFPPSSLHVQNCLTVNHPCKSYDCYWIKYPIITDRLTLNKLFNYIKFCLRFAKWDCNSTLTRLHNVKEITTAPILMVNTSAMINQEPTIF